MVYEQVTCVRWTCTPTPLGLTWGEVLGVLSVACFVAALVLLIWWWIKDKRR